MKRELLIFCFMFLVGTSEMQAVASSVKVASTIDAFKPPQSLHNQIKDMLSSRENFEEFRAKVDPSGALEGAVRMILGKPTKKEASAQSLVQQMDPLEAQTGDKVLFVAAVIFEAGILFLHLYDTKKSVKEEHAKKKIFTFLMLIANALWFGGFVLILDYDLTIKSSQQNAVENIIPMLLKTLSAAIFILQPMAEIMKYNFDGTDHKDLTPEEVVMKYSNSLAILLLLVANMVSTAFIMQDGPTPGMTTFFGQNYFLIAMCCFTVGCALLFVSDPNVGKDLYEHAPTRAKAFSIMGATLLLGGCTVLLIGDLIAK